MEKKLSVVVSCYNEELALRQFYAETSKVLKSLSWDYELIFVNDGSQDGSIEILKELAAGLVYVENDGTAFQRFCLLRQEKRYQGSLDTIWRTCAAGNGHG